MSIPGASYIRFLLLALLLLPFAREGLGQRQNHQTSSPGQLTKLASDQNLKYQLNKARVRELAKKPHWFISTVTAEGQHLSLEGISESGKPLYYSTFNNAYSGITTNTHRVQPGGSAGLNLSGASPALAGKLGIWDGGAILATHQELVGRIVNRDSTTKLSDHATHVAGTMVATGLNPIAKGMSFQAQDLQSWYFDNDNSEIAAAASSLLLSNHSYGFQAGWVKSGGQWYWLGHTAVSQKDDVYFGYYDYYAQLWDNIAYQAPYYLIVKAAGNSRNMNEPAVGVPYYWMNQVTGNWELNSKGRAADMRFYNGYDVIPDHSVAKNILTVTAISPLPNGYTQPSDAVAYVASSFGPTDDGRIKPDLGGSGIQVWSTVATANDAYQKATGTSMAAPNITGSLFLLQEHYANLNEGRFMRASTLKGLALHAAQEAGKFPGPDYVFGWGVMDSDEATRVISGSGTKDLVRELSLQQDSTYSLSFTASGTEPVKVTICWTDPQGQILPLNDSTALNNRTPMLVNDLDLRLTGGDNTLLPWILDPENPAAPATTGDNFRDNVEQVFLVNPIPGQTYTLTVKHKNALTNGLQDFALFISGQAPPPYCASGPSAPTSRAGIEKLEFGTIDNASPGSCGTYSDFTALSTNVEPGKIMPLTLKLGNCGPAEVEKIAKVFIDWNEDGDFEDAGERVLTTATVAGPVTLTTNVTIPAFVRVGNGTRMRVVLVETNDADGVTACGLFDQGETEDYTLKFQRQVKDVGITALTIPTPTTLWANPAQNLTVRIKNFDAIPQTNIPVSVTIKSGATAVATLTGTFQGTLNPMQEALFTLAGTFPANAATTYDFVAATHLAGDQNLNNNSFTTSITSSALTAAPTFSVFACPENPRVTLQGSGEGTLVWFDALSNGTRLALGPDTSTTFKPADKMYYAALNDFAATTLTLQNTAEGIYSSQENDTLYLKAAASVILDRVSINTGVGGQVTVKLLHLDGTLVDSVQLTLVPGLAEYGLNLMTPAGAGQYGLMISRFYKGASANNHNGAGTLAYPYVTPALLTVTNSASGSGYLYNLKFRAAASPSARVGVKANGLLTTSHPVVCGGTNTGTLTLTRYHGDILRWERSVDDSTWTAIDHTLAVLPFRDLVDTTRFRVVLQDAACSDVYSDPITIDIKPSPVAAITALEGTILCPGATLQLEASTGKSFLWSTGDTTQLIHIARAGTYSVQVTNVHGCPSSDSLVVRAKPIAWTGLADSDWFNAANWNCQVPDSTTDVHIPAGLDTYPSIGAGMAYCRNLVIQGSLTMLGGYLKVQGDFTNEGTFNHPDGTLELNGLVNQQVKGGNFRNLTVKNPGVTTLGSDITVSGSLKIEEGLVLTGNYQITLEPTATLRETESHFITGKVATTRTFDDTLVSNSFGNLGLRIATAAAPGDIRVIRTTGVAPGRTAIKRSFQIQVLTPGKAGNLDASLEFHFFTHELNNLDKTLLALFRSTDSGLTWALQENSVVDTTAGTNKVSLTGIQAFSDWTLADRFSNQTLPVSLLSFQAVRSQADVLLTWETAMEVNNAGMALEVSGDARNYRQLHYLPAKGLKTAHRQQYHFTDKETGKKGIRYYRLKQVDLDGAFTYYGPRAVTFENPGPGFQVFPNPTDGRLAIQAPASADGFLELEIKNASGQTILVTRKQLKKGPNFLDLDLRASLKPGLYLVVGRYDNRVYPLKLVVQ